MKRHALPERLVRYGPAAFMAAAIPALSLLPARLFRSLEAPLPPLPGFDKIVHAFLYAALTAACLHAAPPARRGSLAAALLAALAAAAYGAALELGQKALTTSRAMDPLDALANAAGAFACALSLFAVARRRKPAPAL